MKKIKKISGTIVDVLYSRIYSGTLEISDGKIVDIKKDESAYPTFIIPGFIDSHTHIESSMLTPSEFGRIASLHGTVASVADPHEVANVLGIDGIKYMIEDSKTMPVKCYFGAPPCVPATGFETSGAVVGKEEIEELMKSEAIKYMSEVMNFPAVVNNDSSIYEKITIAKKYSKVIDGHAPGLRGEDLEKYISAGITTDHESFTREEALEKIKRGMKIKIREGSAARDFDEMVPLVEEYPDNCMFCSDDIHPDDLLKGYINEMVKRALQYGIDIMKVLRVACVNPVLHYGLDVGLLRRGDDADFLVVDNFNDLTILKTVIRGELVAEDGRSLLLKMPSKIVNNFKIGLKNVSDFNLPYRRGRINVIEVTEGQLITNRLVVTPRVTGGYAVSDVERDILKIAVVNRYREAPVAIGFVKNFHLKQGAIASSVAHDSHNIVAVGVTDEDICRAVNLVIEHKGGITTVSRDKEVVLPLPVAGLMSNEEYIDVAGSYSEINTIVKSLGSPLHAPFMTLSFMALLVIPKIKLSDRGLFDAEKFQFIDIFEEG